MRTPMHALAAGTVLFESKRPAHDARAARIALITLLLAGMPAAHAAPASARARDVAAGHTEGGKDSLDVRPAPAGIPVARDTVEDQENPPVAKLAVTQPDPSACIVIADASASSDSDLTPVASCRFDFGDGTQPVTTTAPHASAQHTYAVSARYTITVIVTDTGGNASQPARVDFPVSSRLSVERRLAASTDDAEERASDGTMKLTSSTLQLAVDGTTQQTIAMRFAAVPVPGHATIQAAYLQLTAHASGAGAMALTIAGEAADDAATFTSAAGSIAARARTAASVPWAPNAWTSGQAGPDQRTPDLGAVIQEIVNRPGWAAGHALDLIVSGSGSRTADSYDASAATAPLLHIDYVGVAAAPTARLSASQAWNPERTANLDASASAPGASPIATYAYDFGDGTKSSSSAAQAQHTYAAPGEYTVTLIATDTAGRRSDPATASLTIENLPPHPIAVYVGYYDTHHPGNPRPKPSPWYGAAGITFVGTPDSGSDGWDSSGIRIDNLTASSMTVTVTVDIAADHFALWGSRTIAAGRTLVLAQTGFENFDGSDTNEAGCYGCDPDLCITKVSSTIPVVHVTMNGERTDYYDSGQTLNTHGVDMAGCPYTGSRNDESQAWTQIYPQAPAAMNAFDEPTHARLDETAARRLRLDPVSPNPAGDVLALRFAIPARAGVTIGIYDVSGRLVRTHVAGEMEAGAYQAHIDLSGIPAGVYECALRTGTRMLHQRFVHVR